MNIQKLSHLIESTGRDNREYKTSTASLQAGIATVCGMLNNRGGSVMFGTQPIT